MGKEEMEAIKRINRLMVFYYPSLVPTHSGGRSDEKNTTRLGVLVVIVSAVLPPIPPLPPITSY